MSKLDIHEDFLVTIIAAVNNIRAHECSLSAITTGIFMILHDSGYEAVDSMAGAMMVAMANEETGFARDFYQKPEQTVYTAALAAANAIETGGVNGLRRAAAKGVDQLKKEGVL